MTKEEYQAAWDECLVKGWRAEISMGMMVSQFLHIVKPAFMNKEDFAVPVSEVVEFITSLELKRCRDKDTSGEIRFLSMRGPVRVFVASRCQHMNSCLWNSENSTESILESITSFKWSRKSDFSASRKRAYNKKKASGERTIKARSLSKNHDWGTVK
jgi:hypothetical protein